MWFIFPKTEDRQGNALGTRFAAKIAFGEKVFQDLGEWKEKQPVTSREATAYWIQSFELDAWIPTISNNDGGS